MCITLTALVCVSVNGNGHGAPLAVLHSPTQLLGCLHHSQEVDEKVVMGHDGNPDGGGSEMTRVLLDVNMLGTLEF